MSRNITVVLIYHLHKLLDLLIGKSEMEILLVREKRIEDDSEVDSSGSG
jgi:hypothetical protein